MSDGPEGLTHLDARGRARMVDVTNKASTRRRAITSARIEGVIDAPRFVTAHPEYLTEARTAGLAAAKAASRLIPLCHPLQLDAITIDFYVERQAIVVVATTETVGQTGVEMEGMCAAGIAAVSLLGRARPGSPGATVEALGLQEKRGGKSGLWRRDTATDDGSRDRP